MAVTVKELFDTVGLEFHGSAKWGDNFEANYSGVYIISLAKDPNFDKAVDVDFEVDLDIFENWYKKARNIKLDGKPVVKASDITNYLKKFWLPNQNIIYIGQSSSLNTSVAKRVAAFYNHQLGNSGPHTGGYWLKLFAFHKNAYIYHAESDNPRDTEFKMLLKFVELSSKKSVYELDQIGRYLPFANLMADFTKVHSIKNPTKPASK